MVYVKFKIDRTVFEGFHLDLKNKGYDFLIARLPDKWSYAAFEESNLKEFMKVFGIFVQENDNKVSLESLSSETFLNYRSLEYDRFTEEPIFNK